MKKIILIFASVVLFACKIPIAEVLAPSSTTPTVVVEATAASNYLDRDLVTVSSSQTSDHVNTVITLQENEWVVMAGTGGFFDTGQEIGILDNCYIITFVGPSAGETSVEIRGEDYFLAVFDNYEFAEDVDSSSVIAYLLNLYKGADFCSTGMEMYVIK